MATSRPRLTIPGVALSATLLLAGSNCALFAQQSQSNSAVTSDMQVPLPGTDANEDLSDVSLLHSKLQFSEPVFGGIDETTDYTREFYRMQWRSGDPIEVYILRPKGVVKPPVTIYLYGYPVAEDRFLNPAFCKLVTRGGGAAIGFVPALVGQRYHNVPMKQWFVSELRDSIVRTVHDVQMLVTYAASRSDLDGSRIAVFGQGAGATIAGLAATVDTRIKAVDLLDPWGDWPEWMAHSSLIPEAERANFLKPAFLGSLVDLDPIHWMPYLAGRPLKLDEALYETATPSSAKAKIDAAIPASALVVRYPTRSDFDNNALADGKLIAWIQEQLLTAGPTVPIPKGRR